MTQETKHKCFKVPENYFEEFPLQMQQRIEAEEKALESRTIIQLLKPYLGLAAAMILFGLISFTAFELIMGNRIKHTQLSEEVNEILYLEYFGISDDFILDETYASNNLEPLTDEEIIEHLTDESLSLDELLIEL